MLSYVRSRGSVIMFDVGTAGIRAYQVVARGSHLSTRDSLQLELLPDQLHSDQEPAPPDYSRLLRLVGQAGFAGDDIGLVLSPPDVRFCALRLPNKALAQPEHRVRQALAWEVAREMRTDASELEVRYWNLPPGHHQGLNVMAVALPIEQALSWHQLFARQRLHLRRIDVSPCALVHLACRMHTPAENELWGILDIGFRRTTLTVVLGQVPTYIRSLPICSDKWTRRLAEGFEVPYAAAEQIKRLHGICPAQRGIRPVQGDQALLDAQDTASAVFALLRQPVGDLVYQINRCFAYVLQNFADLNATRLLLAGGGANLPGLADYLRVQLDVSVALLAAPPQVPNDTQDPNGVAQPVNWERPVPHTTVRPEAATALGAALLDLESPGGTPSSAAASTVDLLPESCHNLRRRIVHRNAWVVVLTTAAVILAGAWLLLRLSDHVITRSHHELQAVQLRQAELDRQLTLTTVARNDLARQARALSALRQQQSLPEQLLLLSEQAPDGVVFSEIRTASSQAPGRPPQQRGRSSAPGPPRTSASGSPEEAPPLLVRIRGYAIDHNELTRLIDVLQRVPDWEQVELLRAAREPYGDAEALAFQIECRPAEGDL